MPTPKCHHGDDAPRYKTGSCKLCAVERCTRRNKEVRTAEYYRDYRARIKIEKPEQYERWLQQGQRRKRQVYAEQEKPARKAFRLASTGYTTTEAADRLRMENLALLRGWSDLARIHNQPGFTGPIVLPDNSRRWNRQQIDQLAQIMFQDQWKRKP